MSVSFPTTQMTGLASGLDWGEIVDEQISKARKAQNPWYDKIQLLTDKIYLYQEFSGSANSLKKTLDALKLESTFTAKTPEIVVVGSNESPDAILKVDLEPSAQIDEWDIKINNIAVAERRVSDRQSGSGTALGKTGSFFVRAGTKAVEISYTATDSIRTIADKIRSADVGLDAYLIDNRLIIESKNTGLGNTSFTEEVTRGTGDYDALGANGIDPTSIGDIKVGSTTYVKGTDFEILDDPATGGHQVHWLGANRPTDKYNVTYDYDANTFELYEIRDSLTKSITRDSADSYDTLDISNLDPDSITISGYTKGTDYEIVDDPSDSTKKAIHWIGTKPSDGASYDIAYSTQANTLLSSIGIMTEDATHHTQAKDASLNVNGVDVTRSSNDIDDLIGGAKLHLQGAGEVKMEVNLNAENAVKAIQTFVESYNELMEYINVRSEEKTYNYSDTPNTDAKATPTDDLSRRKGLLAGDSLLWQTKSSLRKIISESYRSKDSDGKYIEGTVSMMLSEIGITSEEADFGKSGKIEFDTTKFMEAMTKDPSAVQKLVASATEKTNTYLEGVISTSNIAIGDTTAKKGKVPSQIATWESEVSLLQKRIKDHETKLTTQQANMYKQYATMEQQLVKLQAQASSLSSIFSNLSKSSSSS